MGKSRTLSHARWGYQYNVNQTKQQVTKHLMRRLSLIKRKETETSQVRKNWTEASTFCDLFF